MQYPGVEQLLKDLRNVSDPVVNVVIVTREELRAPLRQIICEHFGLEPSGDNIEIGSFRRVYLRGCNSNPRGLGGRVVIFHPTMDVNFTVAPLLLREANHCLFLGDRVIRKPTSIIHELSRLPRMYNENAHGSRMSLICAY